MFNNIEDNVEDNVEDNIKDNIKDNIHDHIEDNIYMIIQTQDTQDKDAQATGFKQFVQILFR